MAGPQVAPESPNRQILFGWKEIANYLDAGVRTVQRYEKLYGLPVRRPAGQSRGAVMATVEELAAWLTAKPVDHPLESRSKGSAPFKWAALQSGVERMGRLCGETAQLRSEIRAAIANLHFNIRVVGQDSRATASPIEVENHDFVSLEAEEKLHLLSPGVKSRKAS